MLEVQMRDAIRKLREIWFHRLRKLSAVLLESTGLLTSNFSIYTSRGNAFN